MTEPGLIPFKRYQTLLGGVGRSTVYRWLQLFPDAAAKPVRIGGRTFFERQDAVASIGRLARATAEKFGRS